MATEFEYMKNKGKPVTGFSPYDLATKQSTMNYLFDLNPKIESNKKPTLIPKTTKSTTYFDGDVEGVDTQFNGILQSVNSYESKTPATKNPLTNSVKYGKDSKFGQWGTKGLSKGATIGIGIAGAVGGIAGDMIEKSGSYDSNNIYGEISKGKMMGGAALKGGAAGAAAGAAGGTPFTVAAGAVVGTLSGVFQGKAKYEEALTQQRHDIFNFESANMKKRQNMLSKRSAALQGGSGTVIGRNGGKFAVATYKFDVKKYKTGGVLNGVTNIVPNGVSHEEKNKLGTKGMPVVKCGKSSCEKVYEIESDELIFSIKTTLKAEKLAEGNKLRDLGTFVKDQLLNNTHSYSDKFKDLNA